MLSPQTLVTCKFFERLNLPVFILWTNWERGELHFPCSSLPTEWVTEVPDSELSEHSQALWNEHSKLAEAVISSLSLMFLLRFVPCKGWSLEDDQNAEGIIGAIWGQEVELGQGAWWGPKLAPLCKHLTLWTLITTAFPQTLLHSVPRTCSRNELRLFSLGSCYLRDLVGWICKLHRNVFLKSARESST